jgi:ribosomal protein S18 acetylase RimI-like enzyme
VIEHARGLSTAQLSAIADLESRCLAVDGGRLKLEWSVLRSRDPGTVRDVLAWDDGELIGFVGVYAFGGEPPEVTGMVDPRHRRHGLGRTLLDAALGLCADRGNPTALLVVPGSPPGGRLLALAAGGSLDHSEHALVLHQPPPELTSAGRQVQLRPWTPADSADVVRLHAAAFGPAAPVPDTAEDRALAELDRTQTWLVTVAGRTVGTLRLSPSAEDGVGVYGFVVDPAEQGRGIGRRALTTACRSAFAAGARSVHLEVSVDNDHALGLYTSLGFTAVATEEYYELRTAH